MMTRENLLFGPWAHNKDIIIQRYNLEIDYL